MSNRIKEAITEYWGEKCEVYWDLCACCIVWKEYEKLLKNNTVDEIYKLGSDCLNPKLIGNTPEQIIDYEIINRYFRWKRMFPSENIDHAFTDEQWKLIAVFIRDNPVVQN